MVCIAVDGPRADFVDSKVMALSDVSLDIPVAGESRECNHEKPCTFGGNSVGPIDGAMSTGPMGNVTTPTKVHILPSEGAVQRGPKATQAQPVKIYTPRALPRAWPSEMESSSVSQTSTRSAISGVSQADNTCDMLAASIAFASTLPASLGHNLARSSEATLRVIEESCRQREQPHVNRNRSVCSQNGAQGIDGKRRVGSPPVTQGGRRVSSLTPPPSARSATNSSNTCQSRQRSLSGMTHGTRTCLSENALHVPSCSQLHGKVHPENGGSTEKVNLQFVADGHGAKAHSQQPQAKVNAVRRSDVHCGITSRTATPRTRLRDVQLAPEISITQKPTSDKTVECGEISSGTPGNNSSNDPNLRLDSSRPTPQLLPPADRRVQAASQSMPKCQTSAPDLTKTEFGACSRVLGSKVASTLTGPSVETSSSRGPAVGRVAQISAERVCSSGRTRPNFFNLAAMTNDVARKSDDTVTKIIEHGTVERGRSPGQSINKKCVYQGKNSSSSREPFKPLASASSAPLCRESSPGSNQSKSAVAIGKSPPRGVSNDAVAALASEFLDLCGRSSAHLNEFRYHADACNRIETSSRGRKDGTPDRDRRSACNSKDSTPERSWRAIGLGAKCADHGTFSGRSCATGKISTPERTWRATLGAFKPATERNMDASVKEVISERANRSGPNSTPERKWHWQASTGNKKAATPEKGLAGKHAAGTKSKVALIVTDGVKAALRRAVDETVGSCQVAGIRDAAREETIMPSLVAKGFLETNPLPWQANGDIASPDDLDHVRALLEAQITGAKVASVYRVRNAGLGVVYNAVRDTVNGKEERILWHGTSIDCVRNIALNGFNRAYCGKHGIKFGHGTYFSLDAEYSLRFCGRYSGQRRVMFLAKVLVGDSTVGSPDMLEPPHKDLDGMLRYDSTVDKKDSPGIFCVFRDFQALPLYLVEFIRPAPGAP